MLDDLTSPRTKEEARRSSGGKVDMDGVYRVKVQSAFDTYKVNPEEKKEEDTARKIRLQLRVQDIEDDPKAEVPELPEDKERRKKQIGNTAKVSIFLDRNGNASMLKGNLKMLPSIAGDGSKADLDPDLLERAHIEGEEYDLGMIADEAHINCSNLVGRDVVVKLQDTQDQYPNLNPWIHYAVPDEVPEDSEEEGQTPFTNPFTQEELGVQEASSPFVGEDLASKRTKERFDDSGSTGGASGESDYESGQGKPEEDDDLPF